MNNSSSSGSGSSRPVTSGATSGSSSGMSSSSTGSSAGSGTSSGSGMSSSSGINSQRGTLAAQGANSFFQNLSAQGLPSLESFMTPTVKNLAMGILVPAVLAKIRLRWVAFGVAAYYGLRLLNQKGVLPAQAHQAFDSLDRGIDAAKEKIGFSKSSSSSALH